MGSNLYAVPRYQTPAGAADSGGQWTVTREQEAARSGLS